MHIIKLNATGSTNNYLKSLSQKTRLLDDTIVITENQTQGRGQLQNTWHFEPNKSLAFTVYKEFVTISAKDQFYISMAVSLGIFSAFEEFKINNLKIKWPNDIMSYQKKCCGILIETKLKGMAIGAAFVGIGVNVNNFTEIDLPQAISLQTSLGTVLNLEMVFDKILKRVLEELNNINPQTMQDILERYTDRLFKKDVVAVYQDTKGAIFNGIIKGVTKNGQLVLERDTVTETFSLKEIKMLY